MCETNNKKHDKFLIEFIMALYHRKIIVKDDVMSVDIEKCMEEFNAATMKKNLNLQVRDADAMCILLRSVGFQPLSIDVDKNVFIFPEAVILKEHNRLFDEMEAEHLFTQDKIEASGPHIERLEFREETEFTCMGLRIISVKRELKPRAFFSCKLCIRSFRDDIKVDEHINYHNNLDNQEGILKELRECYRCNFGLSLGKNFDKNIVRFKLWSKNSRETLEVQNIILIAKSELYEIQKIELPQKLEPSGELIFYLHESAIDKIMSKEIPICVSFSIPNKNFKGFVQFRYSDEELVSRLTNRMYDLSFRTEEFFKPNIVLDFGQNFPIELFSNTNFMRRIQSEEPLIDDYIKSNLKLTPSNYKKVIEMLIQIEYYEIIKTYEKLSVENVTLKRVIDQQKRKFQQSVDFVYEIEIELDEQDLFVSDILQIGDKVEIQKFLSAVEMMLRSKPKSFTGTVVEVKKTLVYISSPQTLSGEYNLKFSPGVSMYDYQMHALEQISEWRTSTFMEKIFPSGNDVINKNSTLGLGSGFGFGFQRELCAFNESIKQNPEQLKAVKDICKETWGSRIPYIIFGPPGTGKTTTIVEAVAQLYFQGYTRNRILIAMGANNAADDIALRLLKILHTKDESPKLLRIYSASKEKDKISIDPLLLKYSNLRKNHYYPSVHQIHTDSRIVVCTCHVVGILATGDFGGGGGVFSHVIIDEAAAVTEADALVVFAAAVNSSTKVILAGDHKQLGPVLKSEKAKSLNLKKSMMERLCELPVYSKDSNMKTSLRQNYRTHPDIVEIYNKLFYENQLIAVCDAADRNMVERWYLTKKTCRYPVIFHDVRGIAVSGRNGLSLSNDAEIKIVLRYVCELMYFGIDGQPLEEDQIGVISPYKTQYLRIKKQFDARGWTRLKTSSVESFQGQEREVIIVSFVRTNRRTIGFLDSFQRLNVSLSRPKSLLILIGDASYLASKSHWFHHIIKCCQEHGTLR